MSDFPGFSRCPYCNVWLPDALAVKHIQERHPDVFSQIIGPSSSAQPSSASVVPADPVSPCRPPASRSVLPLPASSQSPLALQDRSSPGAVASVASGFRGLRGKTLDEVLNWFYQRGEQGLLADLLTYGVLRPLGQCGCHDSQPQLRPGQRPGQGKIGQAHPVACRRCPRCDTRTAVDYEPTPFETEKNKLTLLKEMVILTHWLEGHTAAACGTACKVWRGTVSNRYAKFRAPSLE